MSTTDETRAEPARAWLSRPFRRLWTASAVSLFGSEVSELALPLLALFTLAASPTELGLLRAAQFLPFLLATLAIGVLVDRFRRLPMMVAADLGRFVLIGLVPVAVWSGHASVVLVCVLVFLAGVLTVLYQMAEFAFLPSTVGLRGLPDANAKIAATQAAMEISGRGAGGVLVGVLTAPVAVAVDAVSYLVSALFLRRIDVAEPEVDEERRSPLREAAEGIRVVFGNRYLRALLGGATTFNLFTEVFMLGVLLHAVRDLHLSAVGLGAVLVAGGIGSFVGSWFGARMTARFPYGLVLVVTLAVGNTTPLAAALVGATDPWLLGVVFLVMGIGIGISNAHAVTIRQVAAPAQLRGRVNAAYRLISWGAVPAGALLGGQLASMAGPWWTILIGATGLASATLWVAFSPIVTLRSVDAAAQPE